MAAQHPTLRAPYGLTAAISYQTAATSEPAEMTPRQKVFLKYVAMAQPYEPGLLSKLASVTKGVIVGGGAATLALWAVSRFSGGEPDSRDYLTAFSVGTTLIYKLDRLHDKFVHENDQEPLNKAKALKQKTESKYKFLSKLKEEVLSKDHFEPNYVFRISKSDGCWDALKASYEKVKQQTDRVEVLLLELKAFGLSPSQGAALVTQLPKTPNANSFAQTNTHFSESTAKTLYQKLVDIKRENLENFNYQEELKQLWLEKVDTLLASYDETIKVAKKDIDTLSQPEETGHS